MTSLRDLPSIDALLRVSTALVDCYGHAQVTEALRRAVDGAREAALEGAPVPSEAELVGRAADALARAARPTPPPSATAAATQSSPFPMEEQDRTHPAPRSARPSRYRACPAT